MDNTGDRLNDLIKSLNITKKDFAISIDYSPGNVTDWIKGRYKPSSKALINIENIYGVSQRWLLEGYGSMFKEDYNLKGITDNSNTILNSTEKIGKLTEEELILIELFRKLDENKKGRVQGFIEGMINTDNKKVKSSHYQNGEEAVAIDKELA